MNSIEAPFFFDITSHYCALSLNPLINEGQWSNVTEVGNEIIQKLETPGLPTRLLVDLSRLDYMGSAQVALLVRIWKSLKKNDHHQMVVECPNAVVMEVLTLAGLKQLWTIVDSKPEAFKALGVRFNASSSPTGASSLEWAGYGLGILGTLSLLALLMLRVNGVKLAYTGHLAATITTFFLSVIGWALVLMRIRGINLVMPAVLLIVAVGLAGSLLWLP